MSPYLALLHVFDHAIPCTIMWHRYHAQALPVLVFLFCVDYESGPGGVLCVVSKSTFTFGFLTNAGHLLHTSLDRLPLYNILLGHGPVFW